jgi:hypothetical protein
MKSIGITLFLILILAAPAAEKILFIGNSYTGGIRKTVTELFKQEKADVEIHYINPGGKNLKYHVANKNTLEKIKSAEWDKIVLQDQSQTPALPDYNKIFHEAADEFTKLFNGMKKKPKVYFYMTWGRRDGDKKNIKLFPDFNTMQKALTENYSKAAKKINAKISPVGPGFKKIHDSDKELFKSLYRGDGSHPSPTGAYLAACIFYAVLLEKNPETIKWSAKLDPKIAATLRKTAREVTK